MAKKKKNTKSLENIKQFISSYKFLYTTLIVLFIIVILLGIIVLGKKREKDSANIVIPILEKSSHSSLSIDLNNLKDKEYRIKVTNYRGKDINKEDITYKVVITNPTNNKIKVVEDKKTDNLMIDQKETTIDNQKLLGNKKQETIYTIQLEEGSKPSEDDKISIEFAS